MKSENKYKIPLFYPYVPECARRLVNNTLKTKFIGQGPRVEEFEEEFKKIFKVKYPISLNSATSALSLAYYLAGIKEGDEVICPVLTCSATNIPLLHLKAKIVFADVDIPTLNPDEDDIRKKITSKTKAIVNVHLSGKWNPLGKMPVPIIGDMSQTLLKPLLPYEDYIIYSFQAIKHITTGDGGMLVVNNKKDYERAKKLRWYGIDREKRKRANFQGREITMDTKEAGWKYHMNDIAASLGIGGLKEYKKTILYLIELRRDIYDKELENIDELEIIGGLWTFPVLVEKRDRFCKLLEEHGIETNVVQIRNDLLTIFGGKRQNLPHMNFVEKRYIHLPLGRHLSKKDIYYICKVIKKGW